MSHPHNRTRRPHAQPERDGATNSDPTFWRELDVSWWGDEGELSVPPEEERAKPQGAASAPKG